MSIYGLINITRDHYTAYLMRFVHKLRGRLRKSNTAKGPLTAEEISLGKCGFGKYIQATLPKKKRYKEGERVIRFI